MLFYIKNLLGAALLPPTNGLTLLLLALLLRRRRWALGMAIAGGVLLCAESLPIVARTLIAPLETRAGPTFIQADGAGAIVILGSGLNVDAPEYGGDTASDRSLVRLRYGAAIARQTGLPILITGGVLPRTTKSEAEVMADIATKELGVAVRWQEGNAMDTADNARFSAALLKAEGIDRVVLVTHAFHMPRARLLFENAGLGVIPAATDFRGQKTRPADIFDFLPQARAIQTSYYALHEYIGITWAIIAAL